jgi:hypothetical protein
LKLKIVSYQDMMKAGLILVSAYLGAADARYMLQLNYIKHKNVEMYVWIVCLFPQIIIEDVYHITYLVLEVLTLQTVMNRALMTWVSHNVAMSNAIVYSLLSQAVAVQQHMWEWTATAMLSLAIIVLTQEKLTRNQ